MFRKTTLATVVAANLFTIPAIAEEVSEQSIIVTASRIAETADQTLAAVTVLTRQDIEKSPASNVADILKQLIVSELERSKRPGEGS